MNWLTIVNTIVSYAWLAGSLWFLWRIMAALEKRNNSFTRIADAAFKASESAHKSVLLIQDLIDLLKEQKK